MRTHITFGEHLTIDGYGGSVDLLTNRDVLAKCLHELPKLLGMHPLGAATICWAEPNGKKDPGGWSGYVLIAESHISAHTFPNRRFLSADVYTCKNGLDRSLIELYFIEHFELASTETNFLLRGTRYPAFDLTSDAIADQ